jgi:hypothetical protein
VIALHPGTITMIQGVVFLIWELGSFHRHSPRNNASHSASLLDTSNCIWITYLSCSPLRLMKSTPTPLPPSLSEPSKYMTQCAGWLAGASTWFSHHSAMKSTSIYDSMVVRGLKSRMRAPSSTAHLEMRPVASRLWRISTNGKSETTRILYALK